MTALKNLQILFLGLALVTLAALANAEIPQLINYQGLLTDDTGQPVEDGTYQIVFTIYESEATPTGMWYSGIQDISVVDGQFNYQLGSINAFPDTTFADSTRWLGIRIIGNDEITPRTRLISVPYAFRVSTVDGATGGIISGNVSIQSDLSVSGKATIGTGHTSAGDYTFIAGENNSATGNHTTVGGGDDNTVTFDWGTVSGGKGNTAGGASVVAGGLNNDASNQYASIGGGQGNVTLGAWSAIPGGLDNNADGIYSFAAGRRAKANHGGTFVWADQTDADFSSTAGDQFLIRANGGVGININNPGATLHVNGTSQMTGFKMTTDASNSHVLTSDAEGNGSWQSAFGGESGEFDGAVNTDMVETDPGGNTTISFDNPFTSAEKPHFYITVVLKQSANGLTEGSTIKAVEDIKGSANNWTGFDITASKYSDGSSITDNTKVYVTWMAIGR